MPIVHILKTHPEYFQKIWDKEKTFEVRKNDRDFKVGDLLKLREYDPFSSNFSTREIYAKISYILEGGQFGIDKDFCVLSLFNPKNHTLIMPEMSELDYA